MGWYLALQGPNHTATQAVVHQLDSTADIEQISKEMSGAVAKDRVVPIPGVLQHLNKRVVLHVRPAAWGMWTFYEMSDEERKKMAANNPVIGALAEAAARRQQGMTGGQQ